MGGEFTRRGCIHHHNYRHLRLFYDYAYLYKNFVEAGIVRILEAATNTESEAWLLHAESQMKRGKKVEPEPQHWITMSFEQMRSYLIVGCMGERVSEPTLKKHLKKLMDKKHILQRVNPDPNPKIQNGARQYLLNCKLVQKELDKQQKEVDLFLQGLITGTDEEVEDSGDELGVNPTSNTPHPGVKVYPTPKDLGGGKSLGVGQEITPGSNNVPREDTKITPEGIQSCTQGGYKDYPPSTYSNYSNITDTLQSSSSESRENNTDSDNETQEEGEEITSLAETISPNDDDNAPTESYPAILRTGASSTIETVTQANKQPVSPIPHRPTGEQPDVQTVSAKQARCDMWLKKINDWRGYALENGQYIRQQSEAVRQLVATYNDVDIAWTQYYLSHISAEYRAMKPDWEYAAILLKEAPDALRTATPEVREMVVAQQAPTTSSPVTPPTQRTPVQQQQPATNPYSGVAQLARQNGRE